MKLKMNRKGTGVFNTILNAGMIFAIIYFIIFFVFGVGGGFKTAFDVGAFVAKVPVIFWVMLSIFFLFTKMRGR